MIYVTSAIYKDGHNYLYIEIVVVVVGHPHYPWPSLRLRPQSSLCQLLWWHSRMLLSSKSICQRTHMLCLANLNQTWLEAASHLHLHFSWREKFMALSPLHSCFYQHRLLLLVEVADLCNFDRSQSMQNPYDNRSTDRWIKIRLYFKHEIILTYLGIIA